MSHWSIPPKAVLTLWPQAPTIICFVLNHSMLVSVVDVVITFKHRLHTWTKTSIFSVHDEQGRGESECVCRKEATHTTDPTSSCELPHNTVTPLQPLFNNSTFSSPPPHPPNTHTIWWYHCISMGGTSNVKCLHLPIQSTTGRHKVTASQSN